MSIKIINIISKNRFPKEEKELTRLSIKRAVIGHETQKIYNLQCRQLINPFKSYDYHNYLSLDMKTAGSALLHHSNDEDYITWSRCGIKLSIRINPLLLIIDICILQMGDT